MLLQKSDTLKPVNHRLSWPFCPHVLHHRQLKAPRKSFFFIYNFHKNATSRQKLITGRRLTASYSPGDFRHKHLQHFLSRGCHLVSFSCYYDPWRIQTRDPTCVSYVMAKMAASVVVESGEDVFRKMFKFYKRRDPPPDLRDVTDFSSGAASGGKVSCRIFLQICLSTLTKPEFWWSYRLKKTVPKWCC